MQRLQTILAIALAGCAVDSETSEAPDTTTTTATDEVAPQVMQQLVAHGLTANDGLLRRHQLPAADGIDHVRYRQTYRGVPVNHHGATAVMTNGKITNVIDHTIKGIDVDVTPTISKDAAIALAIKDIGRDMYSRAELVIDADRERQVTRTRPPETAVNADEVKHAVLRHVLVWEVVVGDGREATAYVIDAHTGAIRSKQVAGSNENVSVWASSEYMGAQQIHAIKNESVCGTYDMQDWQRGNFGFASYDTPTLFFSSSGRFGDASPPTQDYSGGDVCDPREGHANDQTAGVDAAFSLGVTWDMYKNVFGIKGWNNDNQGADIFVHWQENNSQYISDVGPFSSAHINLGDGDWQHGATPHTSMSVVGHEYTHGVDQHLGSLGSLSTGNVISEGIADIGGVLVQVYQRDGGWNNGAAHVTDTGDLADFTLFGEIMATTGVPHSRRFLDRPSRDGSPNAYFDDIDDLDPHQSSGPIRRAFYYIMKGASAHDDWRHNAAWESNTPLLPWGLPGLGVDKGSKIFFNTFFNCLDDADYNDALGCAQITALELFGIDAMNTVTNAFAGVNVGSVTGTYPAGPNTFLEQEPNESNGQATDVDWSAAPAGFENIFKMSLVGFMPKASDIDEYKFTAKCGRHIGALLQQPLDLGHGANALSMRLFWLNPATNVWMPQEAATDPTTVDPTLSLDATGFCTGSGEQSFIMKVTSNGGKSVLPYVVYMDAE